MTNRCHSGSEVASRGQEVSPHVGYGAPGGPGRREASSGGSDATVADPRSDGQAGIIDRTVGRRHQPAVPRPGRMASARCRRRHLRPARTVATPTLRTALLWTLARLAVLGRGPGVADREGLPRQRRRTRVDAATTDAGGAVSTATTPLPPDNLGLAAGFAEVGECLVNEGTDDFPARCGSRSVMPRRTVSSTVCWRVSMSGSPTTTAPAECVVRRTAIGTTTTSSATGRGESFVLCMTDRP